MAERHPPKRVSFILSIWSQECGVWRGYVETTNGSRHYFASLMQMNALLERYGWRDAAPLISTEEHLS